MGSHRAVGALPRSPGRASLRYFFGSLHLPVGRCHQDCPVTDGSGVSGQRVDCQVTRVVCIHTLGAEKHVHPQSAATQGLRLWEGRRGWGVWGSLFFGGGGGLPAEGNGEGPVHGNGKVCAGNRKVCAWDVARGLGAGAGGAGASTPRSPGLCVVRDNGSAHFEAQGAGRPSPGDAAPRHREALTADQAALLLTGGARTRASERTGCGLVPGGLPG